MRPVRFGRLALRALLAVCAGAVAACGGDVDPGAEPSPSRVVEDLTVTSSAFGADETIPVQYTCDGDNLSPPLVWTGAPETVAEYAVVMTDPDAPGGTFIHWVVIGLPPLLTSIEEGVVPPEATEIETSFGDAGYGGPCPPEGDEAHRYRFTVYGLERELGLTEGASYTEVAAGIADAAIAEGTLEVLYGR